LQSLQREKWVKNLLKKMYLTCNKKVPEESNPSIRLNHQSWQECSSIMKKAGYFYSKSGRNRHWSFLLTVRKVPNLIAPKNPRNPSEGYRQYRKRTRHPGAVTRRQSAARSEPALVKNLFKKTYLVTRKYPAFFRLNHQSSQERKYHEKSGSLLPQIRKKSPLVLPYEPSEIPKFDWEKSPQEPRNQAPASVTA
jgi:hypothetical protein